MEWIRTKDRLPTEKQDCLLTLYESEVVWDDGTTSEEMLNTYIGYVIVHEDCRKWSWWTYEGDFRSMTNERKDVPKSLGTENDAYEEIVAWMPLPEPCEREEQNYEEVRDLR